MLQIQIQTFRGAVPYLQAHTYTCIAETRETLITDICTAFPSFLNLPKTDQFLFNMKANDLDIVNNVIKFMNTYLDKRGPLY